MLNKLVSNKENVYYGQSGYTRKLKQQESSKFIEKFLNGIERKENISYEESTNRREDIRKKTSLLCEEDLVDNAYKSRQQQRKKKQQQQANAMQTKKELKEIQENRQNGMKFMNKMNFSRNYREIEKIKRLSDEFHFYLSQGVDQTELNCIMKNIEKEYDKIDSKQYNQLPKQIEYTKSVVQPITIKKTKNNLISKDNLCKKSVNEVLFNGNYQLYQELNKPQLNQQNKKVFRLSLNYIDESDEKPKRKKKNQIQSESESDSQEIKDDPNKHKIYCFKCKKTHAYDLHNNNIVITQIVKPDLPYYPRADLHKKNNRDSNSNFGSSKEFVESDTNGLKSRILELTNSNNINNNKNDDQYSISSGIDFEHILDLNQ